MMCHPVRQHLLLSKPPVYSVSFRDTALLPAGKREDLAVGKVAQTAIDSESVRNDFDRVSIFQRPICNATWDSARRRWRDFVWQGEEGFTWAPTEAKREVLYQCRPFYYRIDMSGESAPSHISVSPVPQVGFRLAPMFRNGRDVVYRPCFAMGEDSDGIPHSRAGLTPLCMSVPKLVRKAMLFDDTARTERTADWFSDLLLMWVEFATRDLGAVMRGAADLHKTYTVTRQTGDEDTFLRISAADAVGLTEGMSLSCKIGDTAEIADIVSFDELLDGSIGITLDRPMLLTGLAYGDDGISEGVAATVMPWRSGAILPLLRSSSGVRSARNGLYAPLAWRGKENAWGNSGSALCDISPSRNSYAKQGLYYLSDPQAWRGTTTLSTDWKKLSDITTEPGALGFVKTFTTSIEAEGLLWPVTVEKSPTVRYFGALFQHLITPPAMGVYVGTYRDSAEENNPATIRTTTMMAINYKYGGARLTLFEAEV